MSGTAIVRYLLAHNSGLLAVVPASSILGGTLPLNTVLPAISITQISGLARNTIAMNDPTIYWTDRVQVTVAAKTYPEIKSILQLIQAALPNTHGTINGIVCDSILDDLVGPDIYDDTNIIYMQSQDFVVKFTR